MTGRRAHRPPDVQLHTGFRYGTALLLTLGLVLFLIAAPQANWSRAVALAVEGAVVVVVAITSRAGGQVRRGRALASVGGTALVVVLTAVGVLPTAAVLISAGLLTALLLVVLLQGLARLIADQGVTVQAVAGAVTVYLLIGLVFAWSIAAIVRVFDTPYFVQRTTVSASYLVYFSFTVLTTTGFGDLTPATSLGRGIAVLEMAVGQIYLVTVIAVLVGQFVGRRQR